jgi:hypothetical protein
VRPPAPAEAVPGRREPRPQRLVGLAVDPADRLPLLDDRLEPVAGGLPRRRLGGDLLRLGGQRLLAGDLRGARGGLLGAGLGGGLVGGADHGTGPGGQTFEVSDGGRAGDVVGQRLRLLLQLARVAGVRLEARLEQPDLGGQVGVAAGVVRQPLGRLAGLPAAHRPLALGRAHVDGAVLVDPAPAGRVLDDLLDGGRNSGRRRRRRVRCGTGHDRRGGGRRGAGRDLRLGSGGLGRSGLDSSGLRLGSGLGTGLGSRLGRIGGGAAQRSVDVHRRIR